MSDIEVIKQIISEKQKLYYEISDFLFDNPETALIEYKSKEMLVDAIKKEGFKVEDVPNIPTAFAASWGEGYPVIAFTAEYDALPNLSQEPGCAEKKPLKIGGPGHGCGHNLLGAGSVGAGFVLKSYIEKNRLKGTVKIFGTPAEERDAAKTFMARDGIFDGVDIALTWHPESINSVWRCGSLANTIATFKFKGIAAHASASPHLGRSALDACELMNVGVNYLREHVKSDVRMHYAYTDTGGSAPNVVQDKASVYYFIRAAKMADSLSAYERIKDIARGAALMTGTELEIDFNLALSDYMANSVLSDVLKQAMVDFGNQPYNEEDFKFAGQIIKTFSQAEIDSHLNVIRRTLGDEKAEEVLRCGLSNEVIEAGDSVSLATGSTDVGDLSYVVPTAQCLIATAAIGTPLHTWQRVAQGKSFIAKKGLDRAVGSLALTAVRALHNPDIIEEAKKELKKMTGGEYVCPIPKDIRLRDPKVHP